GPVLARAFGDGVGELPPAPENPCRAREWLPARGPQKGSLEIRGDPRLAEAAVRGDGEPDRDAGGGDEDRPTDGAAGALELVTERHFDRALAGADLTQSEPVERVERRAGEPALQLGPIGRECHLCAADNDRRLGLIRLP